MVARSLNITSQFGKLLLRGSSAKNFRMMSTENDVIFDNIKSVGIITLNRPKALNSLNLSMVSKILPMLQQWENEKKLVVVKGSGEKSFCAGGDVKSIVVAARKGERLGHDFFRHEYTMNGLIGNYRIPYIAFIDGIVMGGGVGLSVHGHYRIATERTLFAMPETAIGLFPDVGGSYFLPRLNGKLGFYLALTGYRLKGVDVLKAGIATHYCQSSKIKELEEAILECNDHDNIKSTLGKFCSTDGAEFSLKPYLNQINECFAGNTMEDIMARLNKDASKWAQDTVKTLSKMSPTSMKVTVKLLQTGGKLSLNECLQMEYRLAVTCLANHDFIEGVRALLIDKDKNPKWNPAELKDVSNNLVEKHFSKLPDNEELRHKL